MKRLLTTALALLVGVSALADVADFAMRVKCETQTAGPASLRDLTWQQGTSPLMRFDVTANGQATTADTNINVRMIIGPSITNTYFAVRTNYLATSTYYLTQWTTIGTNSGTTAAGKTAAWFYTVYFEATNGARYWTGNGKLYIEETTSTDGSGLVWQDFTETTLATSNNPGAVPLLPMDPLRFFNSAGAYTVPQGDTNAFTNAVGPLAFTNQTLYYDGSEPHDESGAINVPAQSLTGSVPAAVSDTIDRLGPQAEDLNMDGNSVTNIGTNSLEFTDGSTISIGGTNLWYTDKNGAQRRIAAVQTADITALQNTDAAQTTRIAANEVDISRNVNNIILNSFRIAVNGTLSIFNMQDGFVDEYEDQTGIDEGASSNNTYSAGANTYSWSYLSVDLLDNLGGHWKLNEDAANTTVTNYLDDSTDTLAGGDNTEDLSVAGKIVKAFNLDGVADYVDLGADANLSPGEGDFSVALWFKSNNGTDDTIFSRGAHIGGGAPGWLVNINPAQQFAMRIYDGTANVAANSGQDDADNTWHHGVCTWDRDGYGVIFIDSVVKGSNDISGITNVAPAVNGFIGKQNNGLFFAGTVDDVRYYSKVLSQTEIDAIYNSGNGNEGTNSPVGGNMLLQSTNGYYASSAPDEGRFITLLQDDDDDLTLNTDVMAYISSDAGTNWTQVTLADEGPYNSTTRIVVGTNALTGSGTNMKYKVVTANMKDGTLHGSALFWK